MLPRLPLAMVQPLLTVAPQMALQLPRMPLRRRQMPPQPATVLSRLRAPQTLLRPAWTLLRLLQRRAAPKIGKGPQTGAFSSVCEAGKAFNLSSRFPFET